MNELIPQVTQLARIRQCPPSMKLPLLQIDHEISVISKHCWGGKGEGRVAVIKSNQIIIIQKCGANCVYRFFRTVQLTFALCAATLAVTATATATSTSTAGNRTTINGSKHRRTKHESRAAVVDSDAPTPAPRLRLRLGLPHTQHGDFRININLCAQLKP